MKIQATAIQIFQKIPLPLRKPVSLIMQFALKILRESMKQHKTLERMRLMRKLQYKYPEYQRKIAWLYIKRLFITRSRL